MAPTTTPPAGASKWLVYASAAANGLVRCVAFGHVEAVGRQKLRICLHRLHMLQLFAVRGSTVNSSAVLKRLHSSQFVQVVAVTVAFVASIIPGLGLAQRKVMLSRAVFQVAAAAHALRIVSAVGLPQLRPLDTEKLKRYVATVSGTSDAHYLIVCILFVVQRPFPPVMFSPFLFALMRVASFLQKQVPATQRLMAPVLENRVRSAAVNRPMRRMTYLPLLLCEALIFMYLCICSVWYALHLQWSVQHLNVSCACTSCILHARSRPAERAAESVIQLQRCRAPAAGATLAFALQEAEFMAMAAADIAALPLLVITSFLQRSFLLPISYAMLLRTRYHSPSGSKYHQAVWQKVDARLQPYVDRAPPIAGRPLVQQVVEKVKLLWTKQNEPVAR